MALTKEERARRDRLAAEGLKWCPKCSTARPVAEFFPKPSSRDGLRAECRSCERERRQAYALANPAKSKKWKRDAYWRDPAKARKAKRDDYYRNRRKRIEAVKAQTDPDKKREYDRQYRLRPEIVERRRKEHQGYKQRNPEKYRAHYMVKNAIRDGRLTRQPCEVCDAPHAEAHHDDYSKPLDVRWLCKAHHRAAHARFSSK